MTLRIPRPAVIGRPNFLIYVFVALFVLVSLFPLYWQFLVASRDPSMLTQQIPSMVPGGNFIANARRVFDTLSQTVVEVRLIADVPALAGLSLTTTNFDGMPTTRLRRKCPIAQHVPAERSGEATNNSS